MGYLQDYNTYGHDFKKWSTPSLEEFLAALGSKQVQLGTNIYRLDSKLSELEMAHLKNFGGFSNFVRAKMLYDAAKIVHDDRIDASEVQGIAAAVTKIIESQNSAPKS
jgi:hypothetical protein